MTYKTHFVGGICAAALTSTVMPVENVVIVTAISAVSALIPDLDIEDSKMGRKAGFISKMIAGAFGHRGFFHTPILYIALYLLMSMALPTSVCLGFLIGTISHLILDTFNYKGIMWLFPITRKHFHIASIRTRTGAETMFLVAMVALSVFAFVKLGMATEVRNFNEFTMGLELDNLKDTVVGMFDEVKVYADDLVKGLK